MPSDPSRNRHIQYSNPFIQYNNPFIEEAVTGVGSLSPLELLMGHFDFFMGHMVFCHGSFCFAHGAFPNRPWGALCPYRETPTLIQGKSNPGTGQITYLRRGERPPPQGTMLHSTPVHEPRALQSYAPRSRYLHLRKVLVGVRHLISDTSRNSNSNIDSISCSKVITSLSTKPLNSPQLPNGHLCQAQCV